MKQRKLKKIFKNILREDMLANVWDGTKQDKRRIYKLTISQMQQELNTEWRNQTGY